MSTLNAQAAPVTGSARGMETVSMSEECFERLPLMRDRSDSERQAFFERHDTYWV